MEQAVVKSGWNLAGGHPCSPTSAECLALPLLSAQPRGFAIRFYSADPVHKQPEVGANPSLAGEHSPRTPLQPIPAQPGRGQEQPQPLPEAPPAAEPPCPAPGHTFCAVCSETRRRQVRFMSQRIAQHIWPCRVTPHRWRCRSAPGHSLAFVWASRAGGPGTGGWQLGSLSSP